MRNYRTHPTATRLQVSKRPQRRKAQHGADDNLNHSATPRALADRSSELRYTVQTPANGMSAIT